MCGKPLYGDNDNSCAFASILDDSIKYRHTKNTNKIYPTQLGKNIQKRQIIIASKVKG